MFIIIGGDGKEYGPVSAEQVRSWLASGRANLQTKAKYAGTEEWHTLGEYTEFTSAAATTAVASTPVAVGVIDPKTYADDLIARAAPLDIFDCIGRGWDLLKSNFWPLVGATAVVFLLFAMTQLVFLVGIVIRLVFGGVLSAGLYLFFLKKIRGQTAELSDVFSGFTRNFGALILTTIVVELMVFFGLILLILPGIYLIVAYAFACLLVIDRKMEFWAAMEVSRRVITAQWWRMFALLIIGAIIGVCGALAFGIGILVTMPIFIGAITCAYEDLCNPPPRG